MNKHFFFCLCCMAAIFLGVAACGGYSGPGDGTAVQRGQAVTVSQLQTLAHKSRVTLTGNITQAVGREYYTFQDSTGAIAVEIDRMAWLGRKVGPSDTVELTAKVEKKNNGRIDVEVKKLRKK